MTISVLAISSIQILGDAACAGLATYLSISPKTENRVFYILNAISFFLLTFGDIYYNYLFRIKLNAIENSISLLVALPVLFFQVSQCYNWGEIFKRQRTKLFSLANLPYILAVSIIVIDLVYFFLTSGDHSLNTELYQSTSVVLDMLAWLFAIICLSRTKSLNVTLLATGTLMIISADLTSRTIFIFAMAKTAEVSWIHIVWACGVILMLSGFVASIKSRYFEFCLPKSLQVICTSFMLLIAFITFVLGIGYLIFLTIDDSNFDAHSTLWNLPIALLFTMIFTIIIARIFTKRIVYPLQVNLKNIASFNSGRVIEKTKPITSIDEFVKLEGFINKSFKKITNQLVRKLDLSAQVAHDIRSPLTSLDLLIKKSAGLDEEKKALLKNAVNDIRDIVENLEEDEGDKNSTAQIAPLISSILSSYKDTVLKGAEVADNLSKDSYLLFANVNLSKLKRIIINILNNAKDATKDIAGKISVDLNASSKNINIIVSDNGVGISNENIKRVFEKGYTTKDQGAGIGLFYAKKLLNEWGGNIKIDSKIGETRVKIHIPSVAPPSWFVSEINIPKDANIICIDDSPSVNSFWKNRLQNKPVNFKYFNSREGLMREINEFMETPSIYFVDYEFSGKNYTGIDIIESLRPSLVNSVMYLVTSRVNEEMIQNYCRVHEIPLISKTFITKIPINVI